MFFDLKIIFRDAITSVSQINIYFLNSNKKIPIVKFKLNLTQKKFKYKNTQEEFEFVEYFICIKNIQHNLTINFEIMVARDTKRIS